MRNGADSTAVGRAPEPEGFGNRKLIRPSLREQAAHVGEAVAERRERPARPVDRTPALAPGSKKPAPIEQTHAENFYYQKQMQSKTQMVVVTREGEELHGVIEWYDKNCIKLNRAAGLSNLLIYKAAIRYMYKEGEER
jgi:sRNA-binding regulator protein Hfq